MNRDFQALVVSESHAGFARDIRTRSIDDLPAGDVLIRVRYSSLNYKDALSATGNRGVTRVYPHTPGIDAAGVVVESGTTDFAPGDEVLVTGYDLGMNTPGGFGQFIRVPAGWVMPMPPGLSLRESMIVGTAGFTAAQGLRALHEGGVRPEAGPVLVTGASGGVGCLAVMLAAAAGHTVIAASGKREKHAWLRSLGAAEAVGREDILADPERPLLKGRWAGVIETVGGAYLDAALRATMPHGVVAACGNAASARLETSVFPFILRGVRLQGLDSASTAMAVRRELWTLLAGPWKPARLDDVAAECTLAELPGRIDAMLRAALTGRVVVRLPE